jgi:triosephosphate isomerase
MNLQRRPLVAANWKMNGSRAANAAWITRFRAETPSCDVVVCAPAVYLMELFDDMQGTPFTVGGQNMSERGPGAFTGELSAEMLRDVGAAWVIVGHSERRSLYGETDALVAAKTARALEAGLRPIVCVGETLAERDAGQTLDVVQRQLDAVVSACSVAGVAHGAWAYEPVWAIGTGLTATPAQAQEVHAFIRNRLAGHSATVAQKIRILYGGSMKASNALELLSQTDIDGGLIGGASLIAVDFLAIAKAGDEAKN